MKRCSGFSRPLVRQQVVSWLLSLVFVSLFYSLILPNLVSAVFLTSLVIHTASLAAAALFCLLCTATDPSDVGLKHLRDPIRFPASILVDIRTHFCTQCQASVTDDSTHCRVCEQCTARFDHHCCWVNNCVGKNNYWWFFGMVAALEVTILVEVGAGADLLAGIFQVGAGQSATVAKYDFGDNGLLFFGSLLLVEVSGVSVALINGYTLIFHLYVRCRRQTAFACITSKAKRTAKVQPAKYVPSNQLRGTSQSTLQNDAIAAKTFQLEGFSEYADPYFSVDHSNGLGEDMTVCVERSEAGTLERKLGESRIEELRKAE